MTTQRHSPKQLPTSNDNVTTLQEIVILAYDIYHKVFGSGTGTDRITSNVYEIRTSSEHAPILKSILCKASQPEHHPTVQLIHMESRALPTKISIKRLSKNKTRSSKTIQSFLSTTSTKKTLKHSLS